MLRFDAPGLDLGQGGEGGRVLGLDELKQLQALDRARGDGKTLRGGGLLQLQHLATTVVKFHGGLGPPGVMREVGAQGQAQLVDGNRAAKVQRECGVGVAVDAPALVGPDAVGVVLVNAVDGVAGRKDSFAAGLNVGMGMGEEAGIAVLVIGVVGKVAARGDLLRGGKAGADDVAGTGKALGAVGDGLLTERDVEVDLALDDVDEGRGHCVLKLDDHILAGRADLQRDTVTGLVGVHVNKADLPGGGGRQQRHAVGVEELELDEFHFILSPFILSQGKAVE